MLSDEELEEFERYRMKETEWPLAKSWIIHDILLMELKETRERLKKAEEALELFTS